MRYDPLQRTISWLLRVFVLAAILAFLVRRTWMLFKSLACTVERAIRRVYE